MGIVYPISTKVVFYDADRLLDMLGTPCENLVEMDFWQALLFLTIRTNTQRNKIRLENFTSYAL